MTSPGLISGSGFGDGDGNGGGGGGSPRESNTERAGVGLGGGVFERWEAERVFCFCPALCAEAIKEPGVQDAVKSTMPANNSIAANSQGRSQRPGVSIVLFFRCDIGAGWVLSSTGVFTSCDFHRCQDLFADAVLAKFT